MKRPLALALAVLITTSVFAQTDPRVRNRRLPATAVPLRFRRQLEDMKDAISAQQQQIQQLQQQIATRDQAIQQLQQQVANLPAPQPQQPAAAPGLLAMRLARCSTTSPT